jgi:hypothetical protein
MWHCFYEERDGNRFIPRNLWTAFPRPWKKSETRSSRCSFIPTDSSDLLRRATGGLPGSSPTPAISPRLFVSFFPSPVHPTADQAPAAQRPAAPIQLGLDQAQKRHSSDGEKPLVSAACRCCRARLSYSASPPGDGPSVVLWFHFHGRIFRFMLVMRCSD